MKITATGTLSKVVQQTVNQAYAKMELGTMTWDTDKGSVSQIYRYYNAEGGIIGERTMVIEGAEFITLLSTYESVVQSVRATALALGESKGFAPVGAVDSWTAV